MSIDHDWKTRKWSVQLRGMMFCLDKMKKKKLAFEYTKWEGVANGDDKE